MRVCDTLLPALATEFSVTVGQAARVIFVFAVAYGVFQLCFGPLGDRYGKLRIIALCALAWTPAACTLAGFGFYCLHNTLQTNATQMAPSARGVAMSLFACVLFLGQSAGVLAGAWIADHHTDSLIFAAAGTGLLALSLIAARRFQGRSNDEGSTT